SKRGGSFAIRMLSVQLCRKQPMESRPIIDLGGIAFELTGVAVLVIGSLISLGRFAVGLVQGQSGSLAYRPLRESVGRAVLLGLEFLVAADIMRSVAIEPTFQSVGVLGLLVLVRTFLSWSLEVEIASKWPWQRTRDSAPGTSITTQ